jgi:selenocysteine lyase/cysteine desulfurase
MQQAQTPDARNDEAFWLDVRRAFPSQDELLNLNNAAVSPAPLVVQDAVIANYRYANQHPDVNMWERLDSTRTRTKTKLAALADCDAEEIALNRNSSEGLCTAIFGIPLQVGDEVLIADWDYASMRRAWQQRAQREGVRVVNVAFDPLASDDEVVAAYREAITPRTRVLHLTHMLHYTGRVLPAERLCALARHAGILTVVDGAQSFGQIPVSFRRLDCDYFVTSLHKWLCGPIGSGMLIVRASCIDATWPLLAPFDDDPIGIAKFEHWNLGTYCSHVENAIDGAIDFHVSIGIERIHARLRELSRYWVAQASEISGFRLHTPLDSPNLSAVTLFSIDGMDVETIEKRLRDEHAIRVRFRRQAGLAGVRVSPHLYTLKSELDRFVAALRTITAASY